MRMLTKGVVAATLATAMVLIDAGCYDYGSRSYGPPAVVPVDGVRLTPQVIQLSTIGETKQLVATVSPANASDKVVTWESSDPLVATVDANGLVTARGVGDAVFVTVFTRDGHFQASTNVTVVPPAAEARRD